MVETDARTERQMLLKPVSITKRGDETDAVWLADGLRQ